MVELVVDLYGLDIAELFQIQCDQVGDCKVFAICCAYASEMNMRDIIYNFKFCEPCEAVIERSVSPSIFCRAGTFEIFLQDAFGQVG